MATGDTIEIVIEEGTCGCGCGAPVKRSFAQGHDARLRGILGRAHLAGQKVAITKAGKRVVTDAAVVMQEHGLPLPAPKVAKKAAAKSAKTTTKATATKGTSTAKAKTTKTKALAAGLPKTTTRKPPRVAPRKAAAKS